MMETAVRVRPGRRGRRTYETWDESMRYPQIVVYETDGSLARQLRPLAEKEHWLLREPRQPEACLRLLQCNEPSVLVLKVDPGFDKKPTAHRGADKGADPVSNADEKLFKQYSVLESVHSLYPDSPVVAVMQTADAELDGLAWDLGASYVLDPQQPRERLPEIVAGLMQAAIGRQFPPREAKLGTK